MVLEADETGIVVTGLRGIYIGTGKFNFGLDQKTLQPRMRVTRDTAHDSRGVKKWLVSLVRQHVPHLWLTGEPKKCARSSKMAGARDARPSLVQIAHFLGSPVNQGCGIRCLTREPSHVFTPRKL